LYNIISKRQVLVLLPILSAALVAESTLDYRLPALDAVHPMPLEAVKLGNGVVHAQGA